MKRRTLAILLCIALLATMAVAGCSAKAPDAKAPAKQFVNLATGGTGGTYYPLGGAMAEIWNKNIPGMNATAQSTGASVANINMLKEGKVEVVMVQNDVAYYATTASEMKETFKEKYTDLKGLATLYPETIQIVTKADKKIKTVADLKGKKVAVGAAGSGTEANARQILEEYGITYKDINPQYLNFNEAAGSLKDGNVDAAFVTAGHPTSAIMDIAAQHKVVLIPIDDDKATSLIKKYPFYAKVTIPAGTYSGVEGETKAVAVMAMLAVSSKMSDDTAYQLVKTMYANTDRIKAAHKVGEKIKKETAKEGMSIPLHPGAQKFFDGK